MLQTLIVIITLLFAYLIGSLPTGVLISRFFYHRDIRHFGSGNMGATNTFRVLGPKAGTLVLVIDFFKGTLAAALPILTHLNLPHYWVWLYGIAAILGHSFSIYLHFSGGKSVATIAGVLLAYNINFFWIVAAIFISCVLITSEVSLSSMITIVSITLVSLEFHDLWLTTICGLLIIFIFYRHRGNLQRILAGNENTVPFGCYYWYRKHHKK